MIRAKSLNLSPSSNVIILHFMVQLKLDVDCHFIPGNERKISFAMAHYQRVQRILFNYLRFN